MTSCPCKRTCKCMKCRCGKYAGLFDVLSNPTRLRIIAVLQNGPMNVSQIIDATEMEQTCISHSLRRLEADGYLYATKRGRFRIYELNDEAVAPVINFLNTYLKEEITGE